MMISLKELTSMEIGDKIEMVSIFSGLSDEPMVLYATAIKKRGDEVEFEAKYFGVTVGTWIARNDGGRVVWMIQ